jgi:hypothetical protein
MCVDFRELNKNLVKNKFSTLLINELLDELGGAIYFSKLHLRVGIIKLGWRKKKFTK